MNRWMVNKNEKSTHSIFTVQVDCSCYNAQLWVSFTIGMIEITPGRRQSRSYNLALCTLETPKGVLYFGKQCRPRWNAAKCGISSGPTLFATSGTEKYVMGNPILIVFICMGKSIRIQRVKAFLFPFLTVKKVSDCYNTHFENGQC